MFLRYYLELPVAAAAAVEAALVGQPAAWLPGLADDARRHGDQLLAEAGFQTPLGTVTRGVIVRVGQPVRFPSKLAINATSTPPLGTLGRTADRLLLHRLAEATVKRFLDQVGGRLLALAADRDRPAARHG